MNSGIIDSPEALYVLLREQKTRVLTNIIFAGSPGHQILELDHFLRKLGTAGVPRDGKYLWVQRSQPITDTIVDVYAQHFSQFNLRMIAHDRLFDMAGEVTRMVPELGVDVGLSHVKNSVLSRENTYIGRLGDQLYYNVSNDAVVAAHLEYYRLRGQSRGLDPWTPARPAIDDALAEFLGGNLERIAAIHFRSNSGNAGLAIPPESICLSLAYLRDLGFTIVKLGTEPCPDVFRQFDVIDYSGCALRSFRNDLAILGQCRIAMINASGLENILDLMEIPTVSYARWHLTFGPFSRNTVVVPALLFDPQRNRLLSFAEQCLYFRTRPEYWEGSFHWHIPLDRFVPRTPQADELLAAVQEAIELGEGPRPLSALQRRFSELDQNGLLSLVESRVSEFFLARFEAIL